MMSFPLRQLIVLLPVLCCVVAINSSHASGVVFEDGEFHGWSAIHMGDAGTNAYMEGWQSDGNPAPCIRATIYLPSGNNTAVLGMWSDAWVWNPAVDGAVDSIRLQIDVKSISGWGQGQGIKLLVIQDGTYYRGPGSITGPSTSWHTLIFNYSAELDEFCATYPTDCSLGPDFSSDASPMLVGFVVSNSSGNGYTYRQLYDNCKITIFPHVEPCVADFESNATEGPSPLTVEFTDLSHGDVTSWFWDFGNGITDTLQNATHTYTTDGTYTVSLTVSGPCGSDVMVKTDFIIVDSLSAVGDQALVVLDLEQSFPNPFNPSTTFWLDIPRAGGVTLAVHDLRGRLVRTLLSGQMSEGRHPVLWDGMDDRGAQAPSGVYLVRLVTADGQQRAVKVTLSK